MPRGTLNLFLKTVKVKEDPSLFKMVILFVSVIGTPGWFCGSSDNEAKVDENLKGGSLAPGLTSYGFPLGLVKIYLEPSTNDGTALDPLIDLLYWVKMQP